MLNQMGLNDEGNIWEIKRLEGWGKVYLICDDRLTVCKLSDTRFLQECSRDATSIRWGDLAHLIRIQESCSITSKHQASRRRASSHADSYKCPCRRYNRSAATLTDVGHVYRARRNQHALEGNRMQQAVDAGSKLVSMSALEGKEPFRHVEVVPTQKLVAVPEPFHALLVHLQLRILPAHPPGIVSMCKFLFGARTK